MANPWTMAGLDPECPLADGSNRGYALKSTRLSCMRRKANAVRLQLHALACNLANFMTTLAMPSESETWSLTALRERLIKTGARLVRHARYAVFQMAETPRVFARSGSLLAV